ncbi:MAG: hypothetical protein CL855_00655 [Cryomorphaceae bacterium]|nr:hypothetical protein [Cryomorphaceae bacterium]|tara:strand:- start:164 stop:463 length:300 start_codon:yes stop_codon:yes gene_type:complete
MFDSGLPSYFFQSGGSNGDDEGSPEKNFLSSFAADRFFKEKGDYEDRMRSKERRTDILDPMLGGMSNLFASGNYGGALSAGLTGIAAQGIGNLARDLFR